MEMPSKDYMDNAWERYSKIKAMADDAFEDWGEAASDYYTALFESVGFRPGDVVKARESEYASPRFSWKWDGQIRASHRFGTAVIICHCKQVKANGEDALKSAWIKPKYLIEGLQRAAGGAV